jgi:DNA-binding LytR/AlgR family response regulator
MASPLPEARGRPTAVLAEDEPLLADELADLLCILWPQLLIVERAANGVEALHAIEAHRPDIAFLDVHMPLLSGLEVARLAGGRCHVALITAFEEHSIEAFEAGAIDYVLKPFTAARMLVTVQRLRSRLHQRPLDPDGMPEGAGDGPALPHRYLQWINASRGTSIQVIITDDVVYFKADSKYTLVVTADSEALIRKTIKELGSELDPSTFWQIHRSTIVNAHAIDRVYRDDRGNVTLSLKRRKESLAVSEAYAQRFRQM